MRDALDGAVLTMEEERKTHESFEELRGQVRALQEARQQNEEKKKHSGPKTGCFLCKGPHIMKDCPCYGKLAAIQEGLEESQSTNDEQGRMGCLQQKEAGQTQKGLMFMEIRIARHLVDALIDTGATHHFMHLDLAKKLGLKLAKGT
ncbi:hypothetical protein V2J09_023179 [Rumex salicifolius]